MDYIFIYDKGLDIERICRCSKLTTSGFCEPLFSMFIDKDKQPFITERGVYMIEGDVYEIDKDDLVELDAYYHSKNRPMFRKTAFIGGLGWCQLYVMCTEDVTGDDRLVPDIHGVQKWEA